MAPADRAERHRAAAHHGNAARVLWAAATMGGAQVCRGQHAGEGARHLDCRGALAVARLARQHVVEQQRQRRLGRGWGEESDAQPAPRAAAPAPSGLPQAPAIRASTLPRILPGPDLEGRSIAARRISASLVLRARRGPGPAQSGMRVSRLNQLFSPARLTPNGGVTETRMAIAGAANFIRLYRQQRETIDREFQDSFVVMTKRASCRRPRSGSGTQR